jgi:hypothetical protein
MPGRGPQTFKKRQKEQERKERQQEKMAKRLARKDEQPKTDSDSESETAAVLEIPAEQSAQPD